MKTKINKMENTFSEILKLDDLSTQRIIQNTDHYDIAKALKEADTKTQEKFYKNMSKRASKMIKENMLYMGPIRLSDAEGAQRKILSIIKFLCERHEISIPENFHFPDNISFPQNSSPVDEKDCFDLGPLPDCFNKIEFTENFYTFFERALFCSKKSRIEGLLALEEDLEKIDNAWDIFKHGLRLVIGGNDANFIGKYLFNIISQEKDQCLRLHKIIQREAVLMIQEGCNPWIFALVLNSYTAIPLNNSKMQKLFRKI